MHTRQHIRQLQHEFRQLNDTLSCLYDWRRAIHAYVEMSGGDRGVYAEMRDCGDNICDCLNRMAVIRLELKELL